ncbi:hypothetical protein PTSG_00493 [Salpingoeca rosetta]|uniref:BRISC and BRCA1-A complex member 1 n=1 Tax=Salpingoeca rosetta (strain ATCC 50818 / BSB-021) TaxID=946362 RepID=F2TWM3_SALR5|nr:uncharacterized protein PTSG_00493 [Salpingoeca rosetta]EGD72469.1 hypothetical protein PTSG_00493 [Salpingoeca rosetta]|eukprot:XP_004999038.1 hypothetical protein PTSG_00493 [Salpingoeca rosetta]
MASGEKLVFVVDVSSEMAASPFNDKKGKSRLDHVKSAIKKLVEFKSLISPRHTYGLALLTSEMVWLFQPGDKMTFLDMLGHVDVQGTFSECQLDSLVANLEPLLSQTSSGLHTVRAILIYGRSRVLPTWTDANRLLSDGRFVLDVLYLFDREAMMGDASSLASGSAHHRPDAADGEAAGVFDALVRLVAPSQRSYLFSVSTSVLRLYQSMASLAAHPLQRPPVDHISYSLSGSPEATSHSGDDGGDSDLVVVDGDSS